MAEDSLITGRPYLRFEEALEKAKCSVDDLFYKAEIGELVVYVITDGWQAGRIYEIDHSIDFAWPPTLTFRGTDPGPMPLPENGDGDNYEETLRQWNRLNDSRDQIFGNVIDYGRFGVFRDKYKWPLVDQQPIAAHTFKAYRIDPTKAAIELDLNQILNKPDKTHERYIRPEPSVLLQDSLSNGKLVVGKADLERLLGESPDENLSVMFRHDYWPDELGVAIAAWQHARDNFKPGMNPKVIIKEWLEEKNQYSKRFSKEAIERISTIANWKKTGGREKEMEGE